MFQMKYFPLPLCDTREVLYFLFTRQEYSVLQMFLVNRMGILLKTNDAIYNFCLKNYLFSIYIILERSFSIKQNILHEKKTLL